MITWNGKKAAIIAALKKDGFNQNKTTGNYQKSVPYEDSIRIATVYLEFQPKPNESVPVRMVNPDNLDEGPSDIDIDKVIETTKLIIRTAINDTNTESTRVEPPAQPEKTKHNDKKPNTSDDTTVIVQTPKTDMGISGPSELTIDLIQSLINPLATVEEAKFFLELCKSQGLNPFIGEAYLIKYGTGAATYVVGKDAHLKRAEQQSSFDGFKAGIIVRTEKGDLEEREGNFYIDETEDLVGGWAEVHRKDIELYFISKVSLKEYIGRKGDGSVTKMWNTKPGTMIRKVALVQALRETYIGLLGGMYDISEIEDIGDVEVIE